MNEQELATQLSEANEEIVRLQDRIHSLESRTTSLPKTMLLDESFLKRAFAVLGHYFVASLIIAIPFYILLFLIMIAVRGV